MSQNPMVVSGLIQGIGSGIGASAQAKAEERQAEARRKAIADNYGSGASIYEGPDVSDKLAVATEAPRKIWRVDPKTGNIFQEYA